MNDRPNKDPNKKGPDMKINIVMLITLGIIMTFVINLTLTHLSSDHSTKVLYSDFIKFIEADAVKELQFTSDTATFKLNPNTDREIVAELFQESIETDIKNSETIGFLNIFHKSEPLTDEQIQAVKEESINKFLDENRSFYTGYIYNEALLPLLKEHDVDFERELVQTNMVFEIVKNWILPFVLVYLFFTFIMRFMSKKMSSGDGGFGGFNMGKSRAKLYDIELKTGVTFADFAGQEEAKESLTEIVDFLHFPEKYKEIGAKQPKGALLVGPPGTGKTLLAKAVAGEAKVPFFSISGSEFVELYVGVGASRVRDLFKQAEKHAPCIVFIDEIDAIGKTRDSGLGSNDEREQTLNQLLAEMDGFDTSKGVVILGATNRPEVLDKALLRPGRFDRRVIVEKPDLPGREAILVVHARKVKMGQDIDLRKVALATSGASGADLANMINEGALRAVRMGRAEVCQEDLMESVEIVIAGKEKKDRILSDKEKRMVAFHEIGHALVAAKQKNSQPIQKITIVPRTMGSLGYVMQMPEDEKYLMTKDELLAEITTFLAGRAAEQAVFGTTSTGAHNDIERATKIARSMITQYGMSEKFGAISLEGTENRYLDGRNTLLCSDATGSEIDRETASLLDSCGKKASEILAANRTALDEISEHLIAKETITGEVFMEILQNYA